MKILRHRTRTPLVTAPDRGNALLLAVLLLGFVSAGTAALLGAAVEASERPRDRSHRFEARRAATSVNRLAAQAIWDAYQVTLMGDPPNLLGLRTHLTGMGFVSQTGAPDPARTEYVGLLGLATGPAGEVVLGDTEILSVLVHRVDAPRSTQLVVTTEAVQRRGYRGATTEAAESVTEVFSMEPALWKGLDYALLANNINCIMCHTTVDDARRIYFGDGIAGAGPARRAKVGSIESIQLRDDPSSSVAGTLYLGGPAIDEHGRPITDWGGYNFLGGAMDDEGNLAQDGSGDPLLTHLDPADPADPQPYENLYTNYFDLPDQVDGELPESFPLPFQDDGGFDVATGEATPAGAGNRQVDDNEFAATTAGFTGSISGGAIGLVSPGARVTSRGAAEGLVSGNTAALGSVTAGNVVLTGSADEPIRISGDVAIDGDLIISGPIEGTGSLWVRGNIYIRGDITYADVLAGPDRQFGLNSQGSLNALGLTAGGNIVMGDPYREQWGRGGTVDGTPAGAWNFTMAETASFNRREWLKTQPELPGQRQRVQTGTRTVQDEQFQSVTTLERREVTEERPTGEMEEVPVYDRVQVGTEERPVYDTVVHNPGTSYEWSERVQVGTETVPVYDRVQVGTELVPVLETVVVGYEEVEVTRNVPFDPPVYVDREEPVYEWQTPMYPNPEYRGAAYVPRYYAFDEGAPVPIQNKKGYFDPAVGQWVANELSHGWDASELTLADPTNPADPTLFPAGLPAAVVESLGPRAGWIDEGVLRGLIHDAMEDRDPEEPFTVDATLYSANSIFGLVPDERSSGTSGRIRIEGSVLASDLGLLGPRGTEVLYDPRSQAVLDIRDDRRIALRLLGAVPTQRVDP